MSAYDSQQGLNAGGASGARGEPAGGGSFHYSRSEGAQGGSGGYDSYGDGYKTFSYVRTSTRSGGGGGGGYDPNMEGYRTYSYTKIGSKGAGLPGGMMGGGPTGGGMKSAMGGPSQTAVNQQAAVLQTKCQEYLKKAEYAIQSGSAPADAEYYMGLAKESISKLKNCALDLRQMGHPNENVFRSLEMYKDQLMGVHLAMTDTMQRRRSIKRRSSSSSGVWEEPVRSYGDAMGWIAQQKRLIEMASWGDDPMAIEQQLVSHQKFHGSIQRSMEVDRAKDDLIKKGDRANLHALEREFDSLQKMSFSRIQQLRELMQIIQDISREIMWVNEREEEELVFDWGDKNIDQYIPRKQESYSKLMSALEGKEKELNILKAKADNLLKNSHPASDKIEAYRDTLQTQWSWLLQITKCIDTHLKENGAYNQFFKEANETYSSLQKEHETIRTKFTCDKKTSLENLLELLRSLEREKEKIQENKRQVKHLVNKSKSIVRLKPRYPEDRSSSGIVVKALCDFKQDQKVILKDNEAILKDNSQRSKWHVTGPGGLDMLVPSVCLIIPPPNPLGISLANKNEQYYEAILSIWNQLLINVKSLIAWQYCLKDIQRISSLTISMLAKMRPEEYRQIIKSLETHYDEFIVNSHGSQIFDEEDKRTIEDQVNTAQSHYEQLVVQVPSYVEQHEEVEVDYVSKEVQPVQQMQVQQVQLQQQHHPQFIILQPQLHLQPLHLQPHIQLQQQQVEIETRRHDIEAKKREEETRRLEEEARWREEEERRLEEEARWREEEERRLEEEARRLEEEEERRLEEEARRLEEEERRRKEARRHAEEERRREEQARVAEEERRRAELRKQAERKKEVSVIQREVGKTIKTEPGKGRLSSSSSSHSLSELHSLRLRLEAAEDELSQHVHVCFGDDGARDCSLKISQLERVQHDVDSMREEYLNLKERILRELEGMSDSDKAKFLRSEIGVINQRLGSLESSSSAYVQRLQALRDMLESLASAEDIIKVHEARLTEKETTSLSPSEVDEYVMQLKKVKVELEQKEDVLTAMKAELAKAGHWNNQLGDSFHRCDLMLSKYSDEVGVLSDRWRRIQGQIDTRLSDLQLYLPKLQHYKDASTSLMDWINATRNKQATLQTTRLDNVPALKEHINNQKALNTEIKAKRDTVESVLKNNEGCVDAIKEYETDLSVYSSGLETLLSIPIKRTMLRSPSMDLHQEATQLQTRYMELLTMSGDYYKYLGDLLKNMEELKIRNTRIDLLEEELHSLRDNIKDRNAKNKSLEDTVSRYQLQLSQSKDQLLTMEEAALQHSATKESLDNTQSQLTKLSDEVARLKYLLEEERRKKKLAEERYTQQKEEYESMLRKRHTELETVSRSKMEVEKSVTNKEHEIEQLQRQLAEESAKVKELQKDILKTKGLIQSLQSQYNSIVKERDTLLLKLQLSEKDKDQAQRLEEELNRIKQSKESELRMKQLLQEENERVKKDLNYWKEQCDSKQGMIKQYSTDKDILEREKTSLKREIERLMKELQELEKSYKSKLSAYQKEMQEVSIVKQTVHTEQKSTREPPALDDSSIIFDGVRKSVTANQLLDCGVLDRQTFNQLVKGYKTVPEVSADKKVILKGTDPIAGVLIEGLKGPGSLTVPYYKLTFTEAKKENLLPPDSVDLLLDAQAATGHIIDPRTNQKLTVEEACNQGVVDNEDRERLLAAEAAAVGYSGPGAGKPLSIFQAMKKELIDKNTTLRLLQAQESMGGILDPILSVFVPRNTAIERGLIDENICHALNQRPELYRDPENEGGVTYMSMKRRCKTEPHTGLLLLPVPEKVDPSKLLFDGVRKPVTAKQLLDCGVLDKPTFKDLENGRKTVQDVSVEKNVSLKGTGPIAGILAGSKGKMTLSEAKKQMLLDDEIADLLLEAQAATGHIIDPKRNENLTVIEACTKGVVDVSDQERLLAAEAAAVGFKDPSTAKPISVFEATKKGLIDRNTALRLLQAQESVGGILDPNLSVFLPKETAIQRNLLDEDLSHTLNQSPKCYIDPDTEHNVSYGALQKRCRKEPHTSLVLLPITERKDPSKLVFDGVRKPVTAKDLVDCGVLDKRTFIQLLKGEKRVPEVSEDKKVFLKGTGPISAVAAGPSGKMSFSEAKKKMFMPPESADLLLKAQAATGHIIDPTSNQKLTVKEALARGVVDKEDGDKLLKAEAAAVGYPDPTTGKLLSVFEAMKKGVIDRQTAVCLLQAQDSAGGILDPNLSVFLPKDIAIKHNLLDEDLCQELKRSPGCFIDPDTEHDISYGALQKRCKKEPHTSLILLPITERKDPSKLVFDGVRKPVTAKDLVDCGVLDKQTFIQLLKGEKRVPEVSEDKKVFLKGTGPISAVAAGPSGKMSFSEAKKKMFLTPESADLLLKAQAATGHIIDPTSNQKLTVKEALARGVVDKEDGDKLLKAEAAAVGYPDPMTGKLLSVFEAMKKGVIDRQTAVCLLQAQDSAGGILDPNLSVFLPKDIAIKHNLLDEDLCQELKRSPGCFIDPDTEYDISYGALQKRCKKEPHTSLILLPITERKDPSKLVFDGVRKPVSAKDLVDCGVLDKQTFIQLLKGEKRVPEVSEDKKVFLKGTGPVSAVAAGPSGKMSFSEAKKKMFLTPESADLLLKAQAATGHIIDPTSNQKLTVKEALARGVVDKEDGDKLLKAEAAAVGYPDPMTGKLLSVFEAMKKGVIDRQTAVCLLQAQDSAGGILDPNLSVFLPKDIAIKHNLLDEDLCQELKRSPGCFIDPDTEYDISYGALQKRCKKEPHTSLILLPITERKDPSKLVFDGVRKPVTAKDLVDCGVLDKRTFIQLLKGEKKVPEVSEDKKVFLKGTGPISAVAAGPSGKMSFSEAKKKMFLTPESADLLLKAQAATGHIIDPTSNQKLTVKEALARGVVDKEDGDKLLKAEAAAVGYPDPMTGKLLSVFEAMKKGVIDRQTAVRLLQAQESAGGIIDPVISVYLPKDMAIKRNILDEDLYREVSRNLECYLDPDTERETSYGALKKRCKTEPRTGLILLPITEKKELTRAATVIPEVSADPTKLMFDGVRKAVSAEKLFNCGLLDQSTFKQLIERKKTIPEVFLLIKGQLKGTGSIAGIVTERHVKMSLSEAKKQKLLSADCADLLLEAQAATGHIIDPKTNEKLSVEDASSKGLIDIRDQNRLLAAEAAAVGFKDNSSTKLLSVFEAMKNGLVDTKTGLRLLQAQESVGGIIDPNLSVFLPKDTAVNLKLLDKSLSLALSQNPACYLDPETDCEVSYGRLKEKCVTEPHTGLHILPISEKYDPSKLFFDGVCKKVTAQQLFDCGILDKQTFEQLLKGNKTVQEVSVEKKVFLNGTGAIAGIAAGPFGKMSFTEAKKQKIISSKIADLLLCAQAATGYIIDPRTNQKLTVKEACARRVVNKEDESMVLVAEAASTGYRDPNTGKILSAAQAMKNGLIDKDTAMRVLQAQESVGGILDPVLGVFFPKDIAMARDLLDEDLYQALNQCPACYLDPDTHQTTTYISLKKKCKVDPSSGLLLLPEPKKPVTVQGLRTQVSVLDLVDAYLLQQPDIDQLNQGRLTGKDIEIRCHSYLRGSSCIAGIYDEASKKVLPIYQAMKNGLLDTTITLQLLEAQAASGYIVDPINNLCLTVSEAYNRRLFGSEFKDKLLAAERAVTGYKLPGTDKIVSLFQAIELGLVQKGYGIRLLEAQISSGGIIDPEHSHRIDLNVAFKKGYFSEDMNKILTDQNADTKVFTDPNTGENLSYPDLKKRCITDKKTGFFLLPIADKKAQESSQKNTRRKRRVVIVDPDTNKEMTVREAYDKGYIDYDTFQELSEQECEWEEITITAPDGSTQFIINDRKTGRRYDITELLEKQIIDQSVVDQYRSRNLTLNQFADILANKTKHMSTLSTSTSRQSATSSTSSVPSAISSTSSMASSSRQSSTSSTSPVTTSSTSEKSSLETDSVTTRKTSETLVHSSSSSISKSTTRTTTVTERSTTFGTVDKD
ncbi:desmoplakin-B [Pholidichthys leucotaenia]